MGQGATSAASCMVSKTWCGATPDIVPRVEKRQEIVEVSTGPKTGKDRTDSLNFGTFFSLNIQISRSDMRVQGPASTASNQQTAEVLKGICIFIHTPSKTAPIFRRKKSKNYTYHFVKQRPSSPLTMFSDTRNVAIYMRARTSERACVNVWVRCPHPQV